MKRVVSYILILSLAAHSLLTSGYIVDYYLNMESYKARCINKDKPELNCDGKCLLAEMIAARHAENQDYEIAFSLSFEYTAPEFHPEWLRFFPTREYVPFSSQKYVYRPVPDLLKPPPTFLS